MLDVGLFKAFFAIFDVLEKSSHEPFFLYTLKELFFYKSLLEKWYFKIEFINILKFSFQPDFSQNLYFMDNKCFSFSKNETYLQLILSLSWTSELPIMIDIWYS